MRMEFVTTDTAVQGLEARHFRLPVNGRDVPGTLWLPPAPRQRPLPLVLLQHGGSGHRRDPAMSEAAARLVAGGVCCCAAIDGPLHGDRRTAAASAAEIQYAFAAAWQGGDRLSSFVDDWIATIDALAACPEIDAQRMGWFGLSMGTAIGMSVLARCPAVDSAVLGKWSLDFPGSRHLAAEAHDVRCRVLFIQHWHDEFFGRAGTLDLFDAIGARDKRLHAYPGRHAGRSEEELAACVTHFDQTIGRTAASGSQH